MIHAFIVHLCVLRRARIWENDEPNGADGEDDEPHIVIDKRNRVNDELNNRDRAGTGEVALEQRPSRMTNEEAATRIGRT
jgi:hypothetical protein